MCGCLADLLPACRRGQRGGRAVKKVVEVERNENVGWFLKNNTCKKKHSRGAACMHFAIFACLVREGGQKASAVGE